jgi:hypothetical protein
MPDTHFRRPESDRFLVERLPDGSAAVFDTTSEAIHSLNQTAALVWECCREPVAIADIADVIQRVTGLPEPRAVAEDALRQLERGGLVEACREDVANRASRRDVLLKIGGVSAAFLAPLVLTLTLTEQHAFARQAGSPGQTTSTTGAPGTTTGGPSTTPGPTTTGGPTSTTLLPTTTTTITTTTTTTTLLPTTTLSPTTTTLLPPTTTSLFPDPPSAGLSTARDAGALWRGLDPSRRRG